MQNLELEASVDTLTISINDLSQEIGLNYEATRKRLRRAGYTGSLEEIPIEVADSVGIQNKGIGKRKSDKPERTPGGVDESVESDTVLFPNSPVVVESHTPALTQVEGAVLRPARPVVFARTWFLYVVYLAALAWQVWHTAAVLVEADSEEGLVVWASGFLFALSVQFTALLMTIRTHSLLYLRGFAVVEFLFNCAYYEPYRPGATWSEVLTEVLISAAIAFTIYSYSELFTQKSN